MSWSGKLLVASTISIIGLLAVGILGGYTIYSQNAQTREALKTSQEHADAAANAQAAILVMGKAEAQLVIAQTPTQKRASAILAIKASSILDESAQRLNQTLAGSPKVEELSRLLQKIGPTKMAVIKAATEGRSQDAMTALQSMQKPMARIEELSGNVVREESGRLALEVHRQGTEAGITLRVLGTLVACCIILSVIAAWQLKVQASALALAKNESELLINCVPSILIGTDVQGCITRWNSSAARTFGWFEAEVRGKPVGDCGIKWVNFDANCEGQSWPQIDRMRCYEDVVFEKAGEQRFLSLRVNPVRFVGERMIGFLITGADITERRALEEELGQVHKLEAIGQLAAGVAHEINTPVQYVMHNVKFVKESSISISELLSLSGQVQKQLSAGRVPEETARRFLLRSDELDIDYLLKEVPPAIEEALHGLDRIADIVRAMKEFSHPGSKEKNPIDINHAIQTTITVARSEWKYVAEVTTDFDSSLPLVPCYAGEFNQVILNLIINAAHAVAANGSDPESKGTIDLRTRCEGSWAEIQVRDTGTGIPSEIGNRVFEPFFTTKEVGKGTGQGLALAHAVIVKKHGGKIWFDSKPGNGTTFFLRLPLGEVAQPVH